MFYIAAVSGGPDSMALLDKYKKNVKLVCHVDYNKRDSSKRDKNIVINYCKKHNINYKILNVTKSIYDKYKKSTNNFQNIARLIRYDFFVAYAKKINCSNLLVAHNLNDFVETGVMQMNKKSKALFWGIKKNNEYKNISIFRPLINKTKKSLENYCLKHKIAYGIDESNSTDLYERNRIRKVLNNKKTFKNAYKQIKKHNSLNKKMLNTVASIYSQWKESQYNDVWFKNQEKQYKYYLIYNLLSENNITNISTEKINNLITFVEKAQKNKFYRLGDGLYIKKL